MAKKPDHSTFVLRTIAKWHQHKSVDTSQAGQYGVNALTRNHKSQYIQCKSEARVHAVVTQL